MESRKRPGSQDPGRMIGSADKKRRDTQKEPSRREPASPSTTGAAAVGIRSSPKGSQRQTSPPLQPKGDSRLVRGSPASQSPFPSGTSSPAVTPHPRTATFDTTSEPWSPPARSEFAATTAETTPASSYPVPGTSLVDVEAEVSKRVGKASSGSQARDELHWNIALVLFHGYLSWAFFRSWKQEPDWCNGAHLLIAGTVFVYLTVALEAGRNYVHSLGPFEILDKLLERYPFLYVFAIL